jgi:hypothetical protein
VEAIFGRREALDGRNDPTGRSINRGDATSHRFAVEVNGAGATLADATAKLGAFETEMIANHPQKRCRSVALKPGGLAVNNEFIHAAGV